MHEVSGEGEAKMSDGFEDSFIVTATIEGQSDGQDLGGATARSPKEATPTKSGQSEEGAVWSPVSAYDTLAILEMSNVFACVCVCVCVCERVRERERGMNVCVCCVCLHGACTHVYCDGGEEHAMGRCFNTLCAPFIPPPPGEVSLCVCHWYACKYNHVLIFAFVYIHWLFQRGGPIQR